MCTSAEGSRARGEGELPEVSLLHPLGGPEAATPVSEGLHALRSWTGGWTERKLSSRKMPDGSSAVATP